MIAKKVEDYLIPLLGAHTARIAVRTFAEKIGKKPDTLSQSDLPKLAESMQGMLKTILGAEVAGNALKEIPKL